MRDWNELASGFNDENRQELTEFIQRQRWFGNKGHGITGIALADQVVLRENPRVVVALIEVRVSAGTSDIYQLVLKSSINSMELDGQPITIVNGTKLFDASTDPKITELMTLASGEGITLFGDEGEIRFRTIRDIGNGELTIRRLGAEQSNTSIVINERLMLKLYRRLEVGTNPELELLLFLTEHNFANVPQLAGWYSYSGTNLRTILGLAQQFLPNAVDGWTLGLKELPQFQERFLKRLSRLGEVIGEMHCVLASDAEDVYFAPEVPTDEATALLGANLESQIDELSEIIPHGRSDELRTLARTLTNHPIAGQLIRTHGDLHLGQLLWTGSDWLVIDFEGEPARSLVERRQKLHPLRDVAGLLRSFSYLAAALLLEQHIEVPADWERLAEETLLTSYRSRVAPTGLLSNDLEDQMRLLHVFQLEKILYELSYEIQHRPTWLPVPLSGIDRLLTDQGE